MRAMRFPFSRLTSNLLDWVTAWVERFSKAQLVALAVLTVVLAFTLVNSWRVWVGPVPDLALAFVAVIALATMLFLFTLMNLRDNIQGIRRLKGQCPACGYDLRAHSAGERCPECGASVPH
jgi:hypothetical protein